MHAPTTQPNQWISTRERMPCGTGNEFRVLVAALGIVQGVRHWSDVNFPAHSHWMPLPEPPKKKTFKDLLDEKVKFEAKHTAPSVSGAFWRGAGWAFELLKKDPELLKEP